MCGLLFGAACLIGLFITLRAGRRWRRGGGCGPGGGCGSGGGWRGHHGGSWGGRGWFARMIGDHIGASPEQRKVIDGAVDEVRAAAEKARDELKESRKDVARAVRSENFDEVLFGELFSRHDDTITSLRKAAMGALGKVHATLDDAQRAKLADAVERGASAFWTRH